MYFEKAVYRVLHERSNITASFAERLEFQKKLTITNAFGLIVANQNKTTRIIALYLLKMLYRGCSTMEAI